MHTTTPYGIRRAVNELQAILAAQWPNGMLPQIRFVPGQGGYRPDADDWGVPAARLGAGSVRTSGITQPPIMGLCAALVWAKLAPAEQAAHAAEFGAIADGLDRYHAWLLRERDPHGENLVCCLHPWETGTDNSPAFDPLIEDTRAAIDARGLPVETFGRADTVHVAAAHRPTARDYYAYFGLLALFKGHGYDQAAIIAETPFLLQDMLFNSLFAASLAALGRLQAALGALTLPGRAREHWETRAAANQAQAAQVAAAIRRKLWHAEDGLFYSYDLRGRGLLRTATVSSLLPLLEGIADDAQAARLLAAVADPARFWTPWPVPSTAADMPVFNPERYWSGPTWPVTNWLVLLGLRARHAPQAEALRQRTIAMILEGMPEAEGRRAAEAVLIHNSFGESTTTPSARQYAHAWLWDSAIVAASWPLVAAPPVPPAPLAERPGFWEYYHPTSGAPLGARPMTWTASLLLELLDMAPDGADL